MYRISAKVAVAIGKFAAKETTSSTQYVGFIGGKLPHLVATDGHRGVVVFLDGYKAEQARQDAVLAAPNKTTAEVLELRKLYEEHAKERKAWAFPAHERFRDTLKKSASVVGWTRDAWEGLAKAAGAKGSLLAGPDKIEAQNGKGVAVGSIASEECPAFPVFGLAAHSLCPWWSEQKSETPPCGVNPAYLADLADLGAASGKPLRLYPSGSALAAHDDVGLLAVIMGLRDP